MILCLKLTSTSYQTAEYQRKIELQFFESTKKCPVIRRTRLFMVVCLKGIESENVSLLCAPSRIHDKSEGIGLNRLLELDFA